jgi:hypothetical protein
MLKTNPLLTRLTVFQLWLLNKNVKLEKLYNTLPGKLYIENNSITKYEVLSIGVKVLLRRDRKFRVRSHEVCNVLLNDSHFLKYYA